MLNNYVNFYFSIMKKLGDVGMAMDIFMDVSHTLEMTICVVNQVKNDSYC